MTRIAISFVIGAVFLAHPVEAAQNAAVSSSPTASAGAAGLPFAIAGPPPPEPPQVIARDASGRVTLRAVRVTSPLKIDGKLDEPVYETTLSMSDFTQNDPVENAPATEKTEVWVFFDKDNVYVMARCWDTHPERMVANEMQRDSRNIPNNEGFAFAFDTFYDRRNSVFFELSAAGGRMDGQTTNESSTNLSWNPVWQFATGRFDHGWTVETRIPFKSLRYQTGRAQIWGFNVRRKIQWKNETTYLVPVPASAGNAGHFRAISRAATLVGLEAPSGSKNLDIKPYAISSLTTDDVVRPRVSNNMKADWGGDVKYGITPNLTADFTYNTDFAQVEADEQQVNLTRFSLFFPEKREFFLENQGTYEFGGVGGTVSNSTTPGAGNTANVPVLFYSRRIGLDQAGHSVPLTVGGRLTGRAGKFSLGLLNIQTDTAPASNVAATNFSVVRVKRDILRKSSIGLALANRSISERGSGSNQAYGIDGAFRFFDNLSVNSFWAQTRGTPGMPDETSYRTQVDYAGDRYGVQVERMMVGAHFNPEIGYVRHPDMVRNFGQFRFSPRPHSSKLFRKVYGIGWVDYIENGAGRVDTRQEGAEFDVDFNNSDRLILRYLNTYEFLPAPLLLAPSVTVPTGGYDYASVQTGFNFGPQRQLASGNVALEYGTFYSGHKTTFTLVQGRVAFPPHFSVEPTYSVNRADVVQGRFTSHLVGSRVNLNVTPLMFFTALLQYNSIAHGVSANVRFRWEYQPGSELFVVLNEQRDTFSGGFPRLTNRSFIVKINRLFRF